MWCEPASKAKGIARDAFRGFGSEEHAVRLARLMVASSLPKDQQAAVLDDLAALLGVELDLGLLEALLRTDSAIERAELLRVLDRREKRLDHHMIQVLKIARSRWVAKKRPGFLERRSLARIQQLGGRLGQAAKALRCSVVP